LLKFYNPTGTIASILEVNTSIALMISLFYAPVAAE
jgi:hypothetical protein